MTQVPKCHPERKHKARSLCQACYNQLPSAKEARRKYAQTLDGKEVQRKASKKYDQTPARKDALRKYARSSAGKETQRRHSQSVARKESKRRYTESALGKEKTKTYNQSATAKEGRRRNSSRYRSLPEGKESRLLRLYGISFADWTRMLESQSGLCATKGCGAKAEAVDHDHVTGKVRELLCHGCNMALGLLREDPQIMRGLADYAEKHGAVPRPPAEIPNLVVSKVREDDVIQLSFLNKAASS